MMPTDEPVAPSSAAQPGADAVIVLRTDAGVRFTPMSDIEWLEADRNYIACHIRGERLRVRGTMAEMESLLNTVRFLRISRSILVNLAHARQAISVGGGQYEFEMRSGQRLVSNRHCGRAIRSLSGSVLR